jgi:hypothetical protein
MLLIDFITSIPYLSEWQMVLFFFEKMANGIVVLKYILWPLKQKMHELSMFQHCRVPATALIDMIFSS